MCQNRMQTGVQQQNLQVGGRCRIALLDHTDLVADFINHGNDLAGCRNGIFVFADLTACPKEGIADVVCQTNDFIFRS